MKEVETLANAPYQADVPVVSLDTAPLHNNSGLNLENFKLDAR